MVAILDAALPPTAEARERSFSSSLALVNHLWSTWEKLRDHYGENKTRDSARCTCDCVGRSTKKAEGEGGGGSKAGETRREGRNHRARYNIIRVRVHQPGKQKDIYVHKAHLLNMILLLSSIYRKWCIQEIKKKKEREIYTEGAFVYKCLYVRVSVCVVCVRARARMRGQ